jgi:hypothetical protein
LLKFYQADTKDANFTLYGALIEDKQCSFSWLVAESTNKEGIKKFAK